ncbi:MAG: DUF4325 domain-containing protein [Rhodospirillaceae bacterium]|jgi:anti-sigma regulatory factor (Ser/Thr protein kinase)|nr:DUF4325 domain-containing protein [Rhodospirillaceae bacterium]MBT3886114.1 DUF4325 domain-containing protein [Rhodospirillaceae bacterium]MBT4119239.1 DUF4325 domain-containing protein [Rhodospirillaceae bacterium]MBT4748115.1 DUF4325 domain-containing protein [Rhodospirillaceae bacterium]MBT5177785.1 DUF4325 domain-containing protein [Rhodospirillaceae bacterium]
MPAKSRQNPEVREFILRNVATHPADIGSLTIQEFGLSRTSVNRYVLRLIEEGLLEAEGNTRARRYKLRNIVSVGFSIKLSFGLFEDAIWRDRILPEMKDVPQNVVDICQYGFTEMLNNAIDHSASFDCLVTYEQDYCSIKMMIADEGIGIFKKIQNDFNLADVQSALLELSKGRLTSDKSKHTGEGIFFTSRMFEEYGIWSHGYYFGKTRKDGDEWLIETRESESKSPGTMVNMAISTDAGWTTRDVFNQFLGDSLRFRRTHVPIKLGKYPNEQLVSRSQAKRISARFDQFSEVQLDFEGIPEIGPAFADEIFRVFRIEHPDTKLSWVNASPEIIEMIWTAMAEDGDPPASA